MPGSPAFGKAGPLRREWQPAHGGTALDAGRTLPLAGFAGSWRALLVFGSQSQPGATLARAERRNPPPGSLSAAGWKLFLALLAVSLLAESARSGLNSGLHRSRGSRLRRRGGHSLGGEREHRAQTIPKVGELGKHKVGSCRGAVLEESYGKTRNRRSWFCFFFVMRGCVGDLRATHAEICGIAAPNCGLALPRRWLPH